MRALFFLVLAALFSVIVSEDDVCSNGRCNGNIGLGVGLGTSLVTILVLIGICVATLFWKHQEKKKTHYGPIADQINKE